jgi:diadenylate cyclase
MWREFVRLTQDPARMFEVSVLALLLWGVLTFLRGTKGEGMLKSLGIVLAVAFIFLRGLAVEWELDRLALVLDAVFQASVIALVVIFQPELRKGLALRIGEKWLRTPIAGQAVVDELVNAAMLMGQHRVGALIAIERTDSLKNYVPKGTVIDAEVKARLLRTIFWPGTPLHDGAVIIQNGRLAAAECYLPLTDRDDLPKSLGTRHRAAIGLSEAEDAVVLVVSEETGYISLCERGRIHRDLDRERLTTLLTEHYLTQVEQLNDDEPAPQQAAGTETGSVPKPKTTASTASTTRVTRRPVAP